MKHTVCAAVDNPLPDQSLTVRIELVGFHMQEFTDSADTAVLRFCECICNGFILCGQLGPDFFININIEIPAVFLIRLPPLTGVLKSEVSKNLKCERVSFCHQGHLPGLII